MSSPQETPAREESVVTPSSVTTLEDEIARLDQALLDLEQSRAVSVAMIRCPAARKQEKLVRELSRGASARGFVSATLSLLESPLDNLELLVAQLLDALVDPEGSRSKGWLNLLDSYSARHGRRSVEKFSAAAEEEGATGDLFSLSLAYLAAEDAAEKEVRAFELWSEGTELKRRQQIPGVRGALSAHSAQRALGELSRLIRALGHRGLLLILSQAESVAQRTERQREKSYTVLRELVDNFDAGRGAISTRVVVVGGDGLFEGPRSIRSLPPLFARLEVPSLAEPPPPHRTWTHLVQEPFEYVHRKIRIPEEARPAALRSLIRMGQGLPPTEGITSMSVGHESIDRTVTRLFEHAEMAGSVCSILSGDYGSGKTHLLLHLAERALAQGHPVFWLNLERMNLDLGNPQKHLTRVLEQSVLPRRGRPSALERAEVWTRSPAKLKALLDALTQIAAEEGEESVSARKALSIAGAASDPGHALENFLAARDLASKGAGASYRLDAYRRLLLWVELLRRFDGTEGPVVLIDEAENLYTSGLSRATRRSALRTLAFYCGGILPHACVVLAMTPTALAEMRRESSELLSELSQVDSTLPIEDASLFRSRLRKLVPEEIPIFTKAMRVELAERVRRTHKSVRGPVELPEWEELVKRAVSTGGPPRLLVRNLVDRLEAAWWLG